MLIYEENCYVFSVVRVAIESLFDSRGLGFIVDDQEVLLGVRRTGDVLWRIVSMKVLSREQLAAIHLYQRGEGL